MSGQHDVTVAARVPLELRADLERARDAAGDTDLSETIRRAIRREADRVLGNGPAGTAGLFAPRAGAARRRDPSTAKAAAAMVAPRSGSQRRRALEVIAHTRDVGATTDEVIRRLELEAQRDHRRPPAVNGVARRVTDLLQAGAIRPVPHPDPDHAAHGIPLTRLTRHGAQATVYVATEKGLAWLRS